ELALAALGLRPGRDEADRGGDAQVASDEGGLPPFAGLAALLLGQRTVDVLVAPAVDLVVLHLPVHAEAREVAQVQGLVVGAAERGARAGGAEVDAADRTDRDRGLLGGDRLLVLDGDLEGLPGRGPLGEGGAREGGRQGRERQPRAPAGAVRRK